MNDPKNGMKPAKRALWLTDTFGDHNGVSMVLKSIHHEIVKHDLPIDIMVCSNTQQSDRNLIVINPITEFNIPLYRQQPLRIPNFITIQRIFRKRSYDRILCSTEGPMGLVALYLKQIYPVKTYFYLHTDWIMFAKQVIDLEEAGLKRLERLMRIYYNRFDQIFVLNSDQQKWMTGSTMRFNSSRILMTAHWVDESFSSKGYISETIRCKKENPVMLFAGRLSREKGIFELPEIFRKTKERILNLHMIIAGTGPNEKELRFAFPEAEFKGWIDHDQLPELYVSADLLILPSRFDTFSCVVLEAMSCGLPVIAYNTKGPKDIIRDNVNGFLVETPDEMVCRITEYFADDRKRVELKQAAFMRARDYSADHIMNQLLKDLEISTLTM